MASSSSNTSALHNHPPIKSHITDGGSWLPLGKSQRQTFSPQLQELSFSKDYQDQSASSTNLQYQQLYSSIFNSQTIAENRKSSQSNPSTSNAHSSKYISSPTSPSSPSSTTPSPVLTPQGGSTTTGSSAGKQFQCPQCPLSFRRNHDLKRHVKIHLPVRPYTCEYCGKPFNRKDALRRHVISKACKMGLSSRNSSSNQTSPTASTTTLPQPPAQQEPDALSLSNYSPSVTSSPQDTSSVFTSTTNEDYDNMLFDSQQQNFQFQDQGLEDNTYQDHTLQGNAFQDNSTLQDDTFQDQALQNNPLQNSAHGPSLQELQDGLETFLMNPMFSDQADSPTSHWPMFDDSGADTASILTDVTTSPNVESNDLPPPPDPSTGPGSTKYWGSPWI